jgi:endoglucanase
MATLYKDEDHVIYEIANEPNNVDWSQVRSYHNRVISAIREIDTKTIIIAGTTTWSQDIHLAAEKPVDEPYNVMYAFHFYACSHGSLLKRVKDVRTQIPIFVSEWGTSGYSGKLRVLSPPATAATKLVRRHLRRASPRAIATTSAPSTTPVASPSSRSATPRPARRRLLQMRRRRRRALKP